ncbi:hypothetical protein CEJ86_20445 [Sinorhizobium meliloti]|uniref:Uncharacterized protein n=1 Tax=Rhizobium meliloti TaxID=382 RepID=A0A2J0YZ75_RHIML|nr:hypothetical protein CEJ86_20445 [Sinorhizobium meliloti]
MAWLDSCDKHRNEGRGCAATTAAACEYVVRGVRPRSTLIPVLVTGIQQRRVCGAEESFQPMDWLDSSARASPRGRARCRRWSDQLQPLPPAAQRRTSAAMRVPTGSLISGPKACRRAG